MLIFLKALAEIQINLKKWKILGFAVTWLVSASLCVSQEREITEVLIIGDNADLMNLAGSGAQVNPEKVQFHKYSDLNQLVSLVPGVYVREEDGFGLRPNIGIRGATSDRSQKSYNSRGWCPNRTCSILRASSLLYNQRGKA